MRELILDPHVEHEIICKKDHVGLGWWIFAEGKMVMIASLGRSLRADVYSVYLYPHYLPWPKSIHPNGTARSREGAKKAAERFIYYWFRKSGLKRPTITFQK